MALHLAVVRNMGETFGQGAKGSNPVTLNVNVSFF